MFFTRKGNEIKEKWSGRGTLKACYVVLLHKKILILKSNPMLKRGVLSLMAEGGFDDCPCRRNICCHLPGIGTTTHQSKENFISCTTSSTIISHVKTVPKFERSTKRELI